MKTIADYQPDRLIDKAVGLLAGILRYREPDQETLWIVECQVAYDMAGQGIAAVTDRDVRIWLATALAERADSFAGWDPSYV